MYDPEGRMDRLAAEERDRLQHEFDLLNSKYKEVRDVLSNANLRIWTDNF